MNAVAMNPAAAGGPVGGMMMMNNGSPAVSAGNNTPDMRLSLNTHIYEYLLKQGHYDIARSMARDDRFEMRTTSKESPGRRKGAEMNGDGEMDMDKDDIPDDLQRPATWEPGQGNGFLFEWYSVFQDLFLAHRSNGSKMNGANMNPAAQYLLQHQQMQRLRENQQNQNLNRTGMVNQNMMRMQQNGMMNSADAQRAMASKMTPQQIQQMAKQRQQMMQQMQGREQQEGEMNGRPGTPANDDSVGSPSKRPRIDNGQQQFTNGMMQNGRPAGMPGAANQGNMILQAGFPNAQMNPQFARNGNMPPNKAMQAGMANSMMNIGGAGSPMMQGMSQFPEGMQMDYRNTMQANQPMQAGGGGPQSGNHALQDYQMQLMLLEQQNKKRLMMARQEQNENNPGSGPMPGVNMPAPGLSPGGSRTGTSPNPGDQMKRNPGMGGMPGSPSAGDMQGRSPAPMGFMNGMPGPDFNGAMFMAGKDQAMMNAGGPGMRPPISGDMNVMRQQGGRVNQPFQGGQPMAQQASQGGQPAMGTPGQRNEMPPPQAPAGGSAQRNQGASPSGNNAPPTPSQGNKANPKAKKGGKADDNKKRPTKKNSTANAPSSDDNPPATPTTSTPITPNNAGVMNNAAKGQAGMPGAQQANPAMQMGNQQMQHTDLGQNNQFADFGGNESFNLDFSTLENTDVLENFDFDSFLNTSAEDTFNFDGGIDVDGGFSLNQTD